MTRTPLHLHALRCACSMIALSLLAACGGAAASSPSLAQSAPAPAGSATPATPMATATPQASATPAAATAAQSIGVGRALFPQHNGMYGECDNGLRDISACPFSARLRAQLATYLANYQRLCPQGCGGAALLLRQQCGGFQQETVSTPQNPSIAIVQLSGNSCLGASETMYVIVVVENGVAVADDVQCNVAETAYGMYNGDPNATSGNQCAAPAA